ncbi:MAG: DUF4398 domain-containing protein [Gemmatimonadaceae bacterium]
MKIARAVALVLALTACASVGGVVPYSGDPGTTFADAAARVTEAQAAGADSLAMEHMTSARANLKLAEAATTERNANRAALLARMAGAEAQLARVQAERVRAERDRDHAQAALAALPPGGAP